MFNDIYYIYIVTNSTKTVLYTGVTNNLPQRLIEHYLNKGNQNSFAGKYHCYNLVHYENFKYIFDAIDREKKIKGWTRKKKEILIEEENPKWKFLNPTIMPWPPEKNAVSRNSDDK